MLRKTGGVMRTRPKLSERMRGGEFLVSIQLDPPVSGNTYDFRAMVKPLVDAGATLFDINSSRRVSHDSIQLAAELSRSDLDVIPHVTLRDSSISGIANQMLAAYAWSGVGSYLVISGDPHDEEKAVFPSRGIFQTHAAEAIKIFDEHLHKSGRAPDMEFAAAFNQSEEEFIAEVNRAKEKKAAGADFFMSQPVFDLEQAIGLRMLFAEVEAPLIAGIWPLMDKKTIEKIRKNEIFGVELPERVYKSATILEDGNLEEWGIAKASNLIGEIKKNGLACGVYVVAPFKSPKLILPLIREFCV